ncbi:MAG: hypothetical protein LH473_11355 [Chitinophagales bacterium]|nr:hypothetical protein [Chitinophagales bacterium]
MKKTFLIIAAGLVVSLASSAFTTASAQVKTTSLVTNSNGRVKAARLNYQINANPVLKAKFVDNPINNRRTRFKKFAKAHPNEARRIILRHNMMK